MTSKDNESKEKLSTYLKSRSDSGPKQSEKCGIPYATMKKYRSGSYFPGPGNLRKIEHGLGINLEVTLKNVENKDFNDKKILEFTLPEPKAEKVESMESTKLESISSKELSEKQREDYAKDMLKKHDVIRDSVVGDIWLTFLERTIINTPVFRRLRGIMQLGPTHLVYPGATHTRFLHSLGVLFQADKIVKTCNKNEGIFEEIQEEKEISLKMKISEYERLIIRLVALLHDIAHVPYSHSFNKEGNLFKDEFEDPNRQPDVLLNSESDESISNVIHDACKNYIDDSEMATIFAEEIIADIILYIDSKKPDELPKPFIHDIVGNTICADLFDYVERDMFYCGLPERIGDRFLNYLAILPLIKEGEEYTKNITGKRKLVLLGYRIERNPDNPKAPKRRVKEGVFSEAIDLLRKRYSLASKVYFHRTKMMLSSLLISAVLSSGLSSSEFIGISDEKVIEKIKELSSEESDEKKLLHERAQVLIKAFGNRLKYYKCYQLNFREENGSIKTKEFKEKIMNKYQNPKSRLKAEIYLENILKLDPGSISIYCPNEKMSSKIYKALVHPYPKSPVILLENIKNQNLNSELKNIQKQHYALWNFCVFIHPKYNLEKDRILKRKVAKALFMKFGYTNESEKDKVDFISDTEFLMDQVIDELIKEFPGDNRLTDFVEMLQVSEISSRGGIEDIDSLKEHMKNIIRKKLLIDK